MKMLSRNQLMGIAIAAMTTFSHTAWAENYETLAKQAIVIDYQTGSVLLEKNSDELMAPSSMSKLMTAYMVFERLKDGSWKMDDLLPVSETAWKRHYKSGGSLMFLPINSQASVGDLLRGVIIQSGNDACTVLAEAHAGTEEAFAEEATKRAHELGMSSTTLKNASGWPDPEHMTTARDLSTLAVHLIRDFPEYYSLYSEKEYVFNGIKQGNRNPLLYSVAGADGLKTGHTSVGGYGLVGSAKRGERRVIFVINGLKSMKERSEESQRLMEWAFREFDNYTLSKAGANITEADVWLGQVKTVPLVAKDDVTVTLPKRVRKEVKVVAQYDGPIPAPLKTGQQVGSLVISAPGIEDIKIPLLAGADVEKLGFFGRISAALSHIIWGPKG